MHQDLSNEKEYYAQKTISREVKIVIDPRVSSIGSSGNLTKDQKKTIEKGNEYL